MAGASREAVIDFEFLRGHQNETVVKELCVVIATVSETFRFKYPILCPIIAYLKEVLFGPTGI